MKNHLLRLLSFNFILITSTNLTTAHADEPDEPEVLILDTMTDELVDSLLMPLPDSIPVITFEDILKIEQEKLNYPLIIDNTIDVSAEVMPRFFYLPAVYKHYIVGRYVDNSIPIPPLNTPAEMKLEGADWLDKAIARHNAMEAFQQQFAASYPWAVRLNIDSLPEPPKEYRVFIDPSTTGISYEEVKVDLKEANKDIAPIKLKRKNWLHSFQGSLQFSQAYNSPNWYQGGNNNVNLISNFVWNVKLNPKFYPRFLFENNVNYKLAVNSAPDDTLRSYSISEDRLQINTKVGIKAANNWYYSINMQFRTQLLQNHPTNSHSVTTCFLSPGELNFGVGMTYNKNSKRTTFNMSLDPLSYNMICYTNTEVRRYPGKKVTNQYGSKVEARFTWNPAYNIGYNSRLYTFTNYEYLQGDWEHTISFTINRYLSTQIYVHLRYDSSTKRNDATKWNHWMLKEILSFGFTYNFNSL